MEFDLKVLVLIGSLSDKNLSVCVKSILEEFGVSVSIRVLSAHRTPNECVRVVSSASQDGFLALVAIAGLSAHLPGVCAAHTELPVVGVGNPLGPLSGVDAALSMLMMPPGVPVACMGLDEVGAKNAALFVIRILALHFLDLKKKLLQYIQEQRNTVLQHDINIQKDLNR